MEKNKSLIESFYRSFKESLYDIHIVPNLSQENLKLLRELPEDIFIEYLMDKFKLFNVFIKSRPVTYKQIRDIFRHVIVWSKFAIQYGDIRLTSAFDEYSHVLNCYLNQHNIKDISQSTQIENYEW